MQREVTNREIGRESEEKDIQATRETDEEDKKVRERNRGGKGQLRRYQRDTKRDREREDKSQRVGIRGS